MANKIPAFITHNCRLTRDGNQWCVLYGENLQEGLAGFGDTPKSAWRAFKDAWVRETIEVEEFTAIENTREFSADADGGTWSVCTADRGRLVFLPVDSYAVVRWVLRRGEVYGLYAELRQGRLEFDDMGGEDTYLDRSDARALISLLEQVAPHWGIKLSLDESKE